eukprot:Amastigsp_a511996_27.p3 type:complete len:340 gc:universal Amastigsp_a511996_27:1042-23(-)
MDSLRKHAPSLQELHDAARSREHRRNLHDVLVVSRHADEHRRLFRNRRQAGDHRDDERNQQQLALRTHHSDGWRAQLDSNDCGHEDRVELAAVGLDVCALQLGDLQQPVDGGRLQALRAGPAAAAQSALDRGDAPGLHRAGGRDDHACARLLAELQRGVLSPHRRACRLPAGRLCVCAAGAHLWSDRGRGHRRRGDAVGDSVERVADLAAESRRSCECDRVAVRPADHPRGRVRRRRRKDRLGAVVRARGVLGDLWPDASRPAAVCVLRAVGFRVPRGAADDVELYVGRALDVVAQTARAHFFLASSPLPTADSYDGGSSGSSACTTPSSAGAAAPEKS